MDVHIFDITVRTREINVFHRAHGVTLILGIASAPDTVMVNGNNLTRFNVPDEFCADGAERAGLATDHISVPELAERQWSEAIFVTAGINPVLSHDDKGESAFNHVQCLHYRIDTRFLALMRILLYKVRQDFTV